MDEFLEQTIIFPDGRTLTIEEFRKIADFKDVQVYKNSKYQVIKKVLSGDEDGLIWLSIKKSQFTTGEISRKSKTRSLDQTMKL